MIPPKGILPFSNNVLERKGGRKEGESPYMYMVKEVKNKRCEKTEYLKVGSVMKEFTYLGIKKRNPKEEEKSQKMEKREKV